MELTEQPEWLALLQPGQCSSRSQAAAVTVGGTGGGVGGRGDGRRRKEHSTCHSRLGRTR